jgi:hypothetical protein
VNGGVTQLNYEVKQFSVLQPNDDFMKGVLLLDRNNQLHVIPENVAESVKLLLYYLINDSIWQKRQRI